MKAEAFNLLRFFQIGKQCVIPIYQRTYSWTEEQCESLWLDIVKVGANLNLPTHFVGSFVYVQDGNAHLLSATPQCMVIDGQQRITTISILLLALAKVIRDNEGEIFIEGNVRITPTYIKNNYLLNAHEEGERRFKLILTQADKETYLNMLQDLPLPDKYSERIKDNFDYFEEKLQDPDIDLKTIYTGIQKLMIVEIALDRSHDNPQLIFESLNSTGLELSEADKIRNYVLMGMEPVRQTRMYSEFWFPMERSFGQSESTGYFDRFIRDYLTLKLNRIPKIGDVYREFKNYAIENDAGDIESLVADISKYAKYFVNMVFGKEVDKNLIQVFNNLNQLKVDVVYPFLLEVYADYEKELLSKIEFLEILHLLESYVFRRVVCGIPTSSMNKTFANLYKEIVVADYLNSFKASMLLKDSYRRLPNDEEFLRELKIKNVYNFKNSNYMLSKIENSQYQNELINLGQFSIEHIMPQNSNLSDEWQRDLGSDWKEIQGKYLHTIGNLTLTGYNSELSDRPFIQKRDMDGGFKKSRLFLNSGISDLTTWNEIEILNRTNILADLSLTIWNYPKLDSTILDRYKAERTESRVVSEYAEKDYKHSNELNLNLFKNLRERIIGFDPTVSEEFKKYYIAYKSSSYTNFVCLVFQKSRIRISLSIDFEDLNDTNQICINVRGLGRWGGGNTQFGLKKMDEIEYAIYLIKQSYESSLLE